MHALNQFTINLYPPSEILRVEMILCRTLSANNVTSTMKLIQRKKSQNLVTVNVETP